MSVTLENIPESILPPPQAGGGEGSAIYWVSCVIRQDKLDPVKDALDKLNLVGGMTVTDVRGFGRQKGHVEHYRGGEIQVRLLDKVKMDIVVAKPDLDSVVLVIRENARTGSVGDGKIFVMEVDKVLRIRTGEKGLSAL